MSYWQEIQSALTANPTIYRDLLISIGVILIAWLLRKAVVSLLSRRLEDGVSRYQIQKISGYVAVILVLAVLIPLWVGGITDLVTYFGLISAGIAIALQGLILDLVGWLFIIIRHPFRVGDRIQIGENAGDVIDLRVFQFSMVEIGNWVDADQSTGRVINIPNRRVFNDVVANYHGGFEFIWNEIGVLVTFESNWKKAKEILITVGNEFGNSLSESGQEQIKNASSKYMIFYKNLTPKVYTDVKDSGVMLTLRYICDPRRRRGTMETIWEAILERFAEHDDIDFAYPTIRTYDNRGEGKPGARAE